MNLAVSCGSGDAGTLDFWTQHATEIGLAVTYCAAFGRSCRGDGHYAIAGHQQGNGLALAGALSCRRRHRLAPGCHATRFLRRIDAETPKRLDVHLIADNYATHKHPTVQAWLKRHPRFHMHCTPHSASWLNQVERFSSLVTGDRIRCGVFKASPDSKPPSRNYLDHHNAEPKPFTWTASPAAILEKVARGEASVRATTLELICQDLHDEAEAALAFRHTLRARPDLAAAAVNLGIALQRTGDMNAAIDAHREAVRLRPDKLGRIAQAMTSAATGLLVPDPTARRRMPGA